MNILVIEDERRLADVLVKIMQEQKYAAEAVYNGLDGLEYARSGQYDVVILDVMLPGMNGLEVARTLRREKNTTPILMLTAKSEIADRVEGLDCGADDYLTKPFATEELLARVRALSRRMGEVVLETMEYGDLTLDLNTHDLRKGAKSVRLPIVNYGPALPISSFILVAAELFIPVYLPLPASGFLPVQPSRRLPRCRSACLHT